MTRLDLPSLGFRIESRVIETDDGPAEAGRLVMVGETERNVRDILAETGVDPEARSERTGSPSRRSSVPASARASRLPGRGFGQGLGVEDRLVDHTIQVTIRPIRIRSRELTRMSRT